MLLDYGESFKKRFRSRIIFIIRRHIKKINKNKISIKDINRNKLQPRKYFDKSSLEELTNSIKEQGVIQPIVVRPDKSQKENMKL